ncbi:MAG: DMT family transporter [Clostridiales bacterium]|nr:DMT family transporter [Clostridiales bacterium]
METNRLAPGAVLLAGALWGSMGIFVRRYNAYGLDSLQIVGIRAAGTALVLFLYLMAADRELLKIKIRDIWCFLGTGLCSIVFFNYCYFKTIVLTDLSVAAVMLYTAPSMVMLMSAVLFGERFTIKKGISLVLAFGGCVLVTGIIGNHVQLSAAGILFGLGSGFGYALYSIFSRYALERGYHSLTISFYTFLIAAVAVLPFVKPDIIGQVVFDGPGNLFFTVAFALVSTVIPYFVYTWGLQYVENGQASILASVEPVVATILGILLFGESLSFMEAAGVVLVLLSIVLCNKG